MAFTKEELTELRDMVEDYCMEHEHRHPDCRHLPRRIRQELAALYQPAEASISEEERAAIQQAIERKAARR